MMRSLPPTAKPPYFPSCLYAEWRAIKRNDVKALAALAM